MTRGRLAAAVAVLALLGAAAAMLLGGAYELSPSAAFAALLDPALWGQPGALAHLVLGEPVARVLGAGPPPVLDTATLIVWNVRLPRLVAGGLVGANLALSGTLFQAITRNDLASPYTLGVGAGSGLAVWIGLVVVPSLGVHLPLLASLGGALAFVVAYSVAWRGGASPMRLVLAGVVVSAIAGSLQSALFFLARDLTVIRDAAAWTAGSLAGTGWAHVRVALPWTLVVATLALASARYLDVMGLGDGGARALGVRVERARFLLAALAVLSAATAVAVAGHVAFVGLIVPHVVRAFVGPAHRRLIPGVLLGGAALLTLADQGARLVLSPLQLPVGVITGLVGACTSWA
ncbi:MAG: iron ABC transporter permease [bacterium]